MIVKFDGVVKPMRRGGWNARGVVVAEAHAQLFDMQVGPRAFDSVRSATAWLKQVAAERAIKTVNIEVREGAR